MNLPCSRSRCVGKAHTARKRAGRCQGAQIYMGPARGFGSGKVNA